MIWKIKLSFLLIVAVLCAVGCSDNRYYDDKLQMELQQLDTDLDNRWSTTGVVIINVNANGPASRADLEKGELVSHVIGERTIRSTSDYKQAIKNALKESNNFILKLADGREIRLAVRKSGDKVGLEVDGSRASKVTSGSPADTGNIKVGDTIQSVIDERNIRTLKDYKEALSEFTKHDSKVTFRTIELIGIKIGAVNALGNLGDVRAVQPLATILESEGSTLRQPAAEALERLVALSQLNTLFQQFQQANLDELPADQLNPRQRESAEILGLLTSDLENNRVTLNDPFGTQFRHRSQALYKKITDGQMVELARKYIKREVEPNQEIRRACISILGHLRSTSAIEDLIAVMEDSMEVSGIHFKAGLALSQIGEDSVDALIAAFDRGDASVKDIAASALGNIGGNKARNTLINALNTIDNPMIKLTLADAVAKVGRAPSIEALRRQKEDLPQGSGLRTFLNELQVLLFNIELKYQTHLNSENISAELRQEFKNNQIPLSQNAILSVQKKDSEWWIDDKDNQRVYIVRKEARKAEGKLNIYEPLETQSISYSATN
jgi:HEAT repeat protein